MNVECKECLLSASPFFLPIKFMMMNEKSENTLPSSASFSLDLFLLSEIVYLKYNIINSRKATASAATAR